MDAVVSREDGTGQSRGKMGAKVHFPCVAFVGCYWLEVKSERDDLFVCGVSVCVCVCVCGSERHACCYLCCEWEDMSRAFLRACFAWH